MAQVLLYSKTTSSDYVCADLQTQTSTFVRPTHLIKANKDLFTFTFTAEQ